MAASNVFQWSFKTFVGISAGFSVASRGSRRSSGFQKSFKMFPDISAIAYESPCSPNAVIHKL